MNAGPTGFANAPVVKALFVTATGSSICWQAAGMELKESMHPLVRGLVQNFVFKNAGEMCFGAGLLYYFRVLERQNGSSKFGGYTFVVTVLSYGLQRAFQMAYGFKNIPSGPYGFIFSSLLQFVFDIPPLHRFKIFGIPLSDKAFTYLMGLQLFFSNGTGSMMAALCGILAGFTYRSNIFRIRRFKFPNLVNRFFAVTIGRLLGSGGAAPIVTRHTAQNRHRRARPADNGVYYHANRARTPASDSSIRQLTSMGFTEAQARTALQATDNDVQAAATMLVDQA